MTNHRHARKQVAAHAAKDPLGNRWRLPGKLILMETWSAMLAVGFLLVLPQVVGLAAARVGRHRSAAAWPLGAAGVVGLPLAIMAIFEHYPIQQTRAEDSSCVSSWLYAISLMALHFAVGSIFGALDRRARARR